MQAGQRIAVLGAGPMGLVEYSNLRPLQAHGVYVPFYMPGGHPLFAEPDQAFLDKVRRYLKKINPALADTDFIALRAGRGRCRRATSCW